MYKIALTVLLLPPSLLGMGTGYHRPPKEGSKAWIEMRKHVSKTIKAVAERYNYKEKYRPRSCGQYGNRLKNKDKK